MTDIAQPQAGPCYLVKPVSLKITVAELGNEVVDVIIEEARGKSVLRKCAVRTFRDEFEQVDLGVQNALYRWVAYLIEVEAHSRRVRLGRPPVPLAKSPDWPSLDDLPDVATVVSKWQHRRLGA